MDSYTMTDQPASLYCKLAAVMAEVGYVQKTGYNSFHKYKYVTEADLVEKVRGALSKRNIALIPSVSAIDERGVTTAKGANSTITTVHVAFTFCDGDSGETHTAEWAGSGDDPADKGLYKAYTGALKYFLMKAFLIPTGDDPEADSGADERSAGGQRSTEPPSTLSEAEAAALIFKAEAAGLDREALRKAAQHAYGREMPSLESDDEALAALQALTVEQGSRVRKWIAKKALERESVAA